MAILFSVNPNKSLGVLVQQNNLNSQANGRVSLIVPRSQTQNTLAIIREEIMLLACRGNFPTGRLSCSYHTLLVRFLSLFVCLNSGPLGLRPSACDNGA